MNKTTENLLTWAPLGAGIALILSDHKRLGLAVAAVSPVTVITQHPKATWTALKASPKAMKYAGKISGKVLKYSGKQAGKSAAKAGRKAGRSLRWMAS